MSDNLAKPKLLLASVLFVSCVAPTFVSYQPYIFRWDDTDYLERSIALSRAFWSWNVHGMGKAMVSMRPPIMTFLGLPWGPLASWEAAGKCFLTLAAGISILAAFCLYLLLRIGVKPIIILACSACVFASLGPYQRGGNAHYVATGFMADSFFAWTCLAAVLLIPYEARMPCPSILGSVVRGVVWGAVLSLGTMTKLSFLFFILAVLPVVFLMRIHYAGIRHALVALLAFVGCSGPFAIYVTRWGKQALDNAHASSFGSVANFYYQPLRQFVGDSMSNSPGLCLSFLLIATAFIYLLAKRRLNLWSPDFLAYLIMTSFAAVVLLSRNREIRFEFPAIVGFPFLTGVLVSSRGSALGRSSAAIAAVLACCGLVVAAVPTRYRVNRQQSLGRSDAILAHAAKYDMKHILLATDSPTLNQNLMSLAITVSAVNPSVEADTLAYSTFYRVPLEEDLRRMGQADVVVFQDRAALSPQFTNQRGPEYERYAAGSACIITRVGDDITLYAMHCARH